MGCKPELQKQLLTAARYKKGYERLEPDVVKIASPVLRRGRASNRSFLFGGLLHGVWKFELCIDILS